MLTLEQIQDIAYERYKLDWMASHGKTAAELVRHVIGTYVENLDPDSGDFAAEDVTQLDTDELFTTWEQETGFDDELWVCKDEFLGAEFTDAAYMASLLRQDEYKTYLDIMGKEPPAPAAKYILIEVIERSASQPEIFDDLESAKTRMMEYVRQALTMNDSATDEDIRATIETYEGEIQEMSAYCTRHGNDYDWTIFETAVQT